MSKKTNLHRSQQSGWLRRTILAAGMLLSAGSMLIAQNGYYHLIMGSHKTFEKASQMLSALENTPGGYHPIILFPENDNGWYRVSGYQSLNRAEVEAFSKSVTKESMAEKPWILSLQTPVTRSAQATSTSNQRVASPGQAVTVPAASNSRYHLIAGSHPTAAIAMQQVAELTAKGLEPYVVFPSGNETRYRVSVYVANNRPEVQAYSTMLTRSGQKELWILEESGSSTSQSPLSSSSNARISTPTSSSAIAARKVTYHLIGGSFSRYDEASDFVVAAKGLGISPSIMWPENGNQDKFRVSFYSSASKEEVEAYERSLKAKGISNMWIMAN
ncbi:MAG: SPOR domain-containing protein [Bacteroidia bacterium]|nr:SPOR domain-containing protein [Bacteroidia bacterium]